jgi:hypothetical protein
VVDIPLLHDGDGVSDTLIQADEKLAVCLLHMLTGL